MTLLFWRFHNQIFLNIADLMVDKKVLLSVTALVLLKLFNFQANKFMLCYVMLATRRSFTGFAGKLPSSFKMSFGFRNSTRAVDSTKLSHLD